MIEMLGVLAIIGILSAGGIMGYTTAMENHKVNKLATDLLTTATAALPIVNAKNGGSLNGTALCQLGLLKNEYCSSSFAFGAKTLWKGAMDFRVEKSRIYIWFCLEPVTNGAPYNACVKLATMKWAGFKDAYAVIWKSNGSWERLKTPAPVAEAQKWCKENKYDAQMSMHLHW